MGLLISRVLISQICVLILPPRLLNLVTLGSYFFSVPLFPLPMRLHPLPRIEDSGKSVPHPGSGTVHGMWSMLENPYFSSLHGALSARKEAP